MSLRQAYPGAAGACRSSPKPWPAGLRSSTYWLKVPASLNLTLPCWVYSALRLSLGEQGQDALHRRVRWTDVLLQG